jgi:GH24 family phage-related lysozyme (muramidase)
MQNTLIFHIRSRKTRSNVKMRNRMSTSNFELTNGMMGARSPLADLAITGSSSSWHKDLTTTLLGVGDSWVEAFVQQRVMEDVRSSANPLLMADIVSAKAVSANLTAGEPIELDGSAILERTDPLTGAGIMAAQSMAAQSMAAQSMAAQSMAAQSMASPAYPGYLLRYEPGKVLDSRPAVAQWQAQMQRRGWTIAVDGLYGPQSDRIARQFQQEKGLDVDGIVGAQTWQAAFDSSTISTPTPNNSPAGLRTINPAGLNLIKDFEGLRLNSYRDAVGVWTIGYGHTRTAGPGQRITNEQAIALLKQDVATFEKAVTSAVRVPITNNQFAALVSFAYNVGSGALNSSTLLRRLNAGDSNGAANEFLRWNRAGGQVLAGLTRRRVAERDLFLS